MKSYPDWAQVSAGLGDKVTAAISAATASTRSDLTTYRRTFPSWVAQSTERGLASWIHDRLWFHLVAELDGTPHTSMVDQEPTREIYVGVNYRIRIKRHHEDGRISSYPTETLLEFLSQPSQGALDGLEEWHLAAGYVWSRESRDLGPAVVSLRDGETVIWEQRLPDTDEGGGTGGPGIPLPLHPLPTPPTIETSTREARRSERDRE